MSEERYIRQQVDAIIAGRYGAPGVQRLFLPNKSPLYFLKSKGRTGAAVRFYLNERVRDRAVSEPTVDNQKPRVSASRGSRRGMHTHLKGPIVRILIGPTLPKPARDDACRAKHKIKIAMKAARRIGWHAAAQDNMKFHPKPQAETKPHHKSAKPRNKAATPATVGEYK